MALFPISHKKKFEVTFLVTISIVVEIYNPIGSAALIEETRKAFNKLEDYTIKPNSHITVQRVEEIK